MEHQFEKTKLLCLDTPVRQVQSSELTQQIPLTDGMPDIGRITAAWGQVIARGKEWHSDRLTFSGGLMVWVLYAPEDGGPEQCNETWIHFQLKWNLPEGVAEGSIRVRCLPRFVDGRSASARKIMVRSGITAMAEAFCPVERQISIPGEGVDAQLLNVAYPVRLAREAGEKTFLLDEELTLPDTAPQAEKLVYYRLDPRVTDKKVLANKVVFRGNGWLHLLYLGEDGRLNSWDMEVPFSQFADLDQEYSGDAQAEFVAMPTSLELELEEDGRLRLKAGVAAQYLITDKQLLTLVEDAYSPTRELEIQSQELEIPAILENRRENLSAEQTLPAQAMRVADVCFLPDYPRQSQEEMGVELEIPGVFQTLYYGEDGQLYSSTSRHEQKMKLNANGNCQITSNLLPEVPQVLDSAGQLLTRVEMPMELTTTAQQHLPMVTGIRLEEPRAMDPGRPTLILRRAGKESLWNMAKSTGSTVEAIRRANSLEEEPTPGQMLLIPVS